MPDYTPISPPALPSDSKLDIILTTDQEELHNKVLAHFSKPEYSIPGLDKGELTEAEKFWLVSLLLLLYGYCELMCKLCSSSPMSVCFGEFNHTGAEIFVRLRVTCQLPACHQMARGNSYSATGRHSQVETRVWSLWSSHTWAYRAWGDLKVLGRAAGSCSPSYNVPQALTGKEVLFGYDTSRRPACYMIPSRQNTDESPRQVQYAVWMLERAIDQMGPGVECVFKVHAAYNVMFDKWPRIL